MSLNTRPGSEPVRTNGSALSSEDLEKLKAHADWIRTQGGWGKVTLEWQNGKVVFIESQVRTRLVASPTTAPADPNNGRRSP